MILDEATSALDLATEKKLFESISDFLKMRTTIIVSHRPAALRHVDRIINVGNDPNFIKN